MTESNITNADRREDGPLEEIVSAKNLNRAYKRVVLAIHPFMKGFFKKLTEDPLHDL